MILGVVPTNLIDPFLKNNTAQLVILGLLIGAGVLVLGDSVPELKRMIEQINKLVMSVMQIVLLTMPAIPFPSILSHIYNLYIDKGRFGDEKRELFIADSDVGSVDNFRRGWLRHCAGGAGDGADTGGLC